MKFLNLSCIGILVCLFVCLFVLKVVPRSTGRGGGKRDGEGNTLIQGAFMSRAGHCHGHGGLVLLGTLK